MIPTTTAAIAAHNVLLARRMVSPCRLVDAASARSARIWLAAAPAPFRLPNSKTKYRSFSSEYPSMGFRQACNSSGLIFLFPPNDQGEPMPTENQNINDTL